MADTTLSERQSLPAAFHAAVYDPKPRLTDLAGRLSRTLGIARALAQSGRVVDMTGIDDGVGMLCAKILDLPPPDARFMLPALLEMLGQVEALLLVLRDPPDPPDAA